MHAAGASGRRERVGRFIKAKRLLATFWPPLLYSLSSWLTASLNGRVMAATPFVTSEISLPPRVAGAREGSMGKGARLTPPLGVPAPALDFTTSMRPQGLYGLHMWGREPGLLLPGPKAWRRDAPFICAFAPPSRTPQPRSLSGHTGRASRTAAAPCALCRASMPPSSTGCAA